jgi:hypothetical protein
VIITLDANYIRRVFYHGGIGTLGEYSPRDDDPFKLL